MLVENIRVAVASLARHRLRTGLSVLGVGIGIAAVICTAALGAAGTARVQAQIDALGDDFLWIRAGSRNVAGVRTGFGGVRTLTEADAAALAAEIPDIEACSPLVSGREQIIVGGQNWNTRYQGALPSYFEIRRRMVAAGRLFTDLEVREGSRVLVLGSAVAQRLFGTDNPVGRTVRMNRFPFTVVGVLASRGADRSGLDRDDVLFAPVSTANRTLDRRTWVNDIMCGVVAPERMASAEVQAAALLRARHNLPPGAPDDFQIQQPVESLELRAETTRTLAAMLTAIGAVSLVVGGIGIMNIMLVSVTERRREIGVRLAIGARVRDIRWQFLLEAATMGLLGGAIGIAGGWGAAWVMSSGFDWPTVVTTESAALAAVTAIAAALVFGYYPAHRASTLDPIDAIRIES